jgi:phosphomannomutase
MAATEAVFKAYDIRGLYGEQIDEDFAWKVGHAAAQFLRSLLTGYERGQAASNRVIVGCDMRAHSRSLVTAMIQGVTSSGAGCIDLGAVDTPCLQFAVNHLGACGGIQVTAAYGPADQTGFKITATKARPLSLTSGLKEIRHIVGALRRMPLGASMAPVQQVDVWDEYRRHVRRFLNLGRRLKVVVDAAGGMGAKMVPALFGEVDMEIVPLNFELGAAMPYPPDPLISAAIEPACRAVTQHGADLGVCLDGDAGRCVFIDESGRVVRCDLIVALLAQHVLADNAGAVVIHDLRCSRVVPEAIRAAGGVARRERVGEAFVRKAMADGHAVFAGELNGSFYFRDNSNCNSAAIALATLATMLSNQSRSLGELVAPLEQFCHSGQISFDDADADAKMERVAEALADAEIDRLDGVTCRYDDWWCNVRRSNSEPRLRLAVEARDPQTLREKIEALQGILGTPVEP